MTVIVVEPAQPLLDASALRRLVPGLDGLDDDHLNMLISVAQQSIEPPLGWARCAFGRQTLEMVMDGFASALAVIDLPHPPLRSIVSITFEQAPGGAITLPETAYWVFSDGLFGAVRPAVGTAWPSGCGIARIRYVAGYDAADPRLLPAKQAIALSVQALRVFAREDLFLKREKTDGVGEREWAVSPSAERMMRDAADRLLQPYRIPRV
ncbi:hypothetical protein ACO2RV_04580 [Ancylobacter sp. VNQ12]|uniref:hypothetical protein n=1 Tax=Ancylobacter sp. VNQ12 TaxID=3400920 RepID=UPI003C02D82A